MEKTFLIGGMHCGNCVAAVKKAIEAIPGVSKTEVDLAGKCAKVTSDGTVSDKAVMDAIEEIGFDAEGIK